MVPRCLLALLPLLLALASRGAAERPFVDTLEDFEHPGKADWIGPPASEGRETGLYFFRQTLTLAEVPPSFPLHLSADPRYKLYVNGHFVTMGPAAGDPLAWSYATVDLADHLRVGENVIACEVWDAGPLSPVRQVAIQTGLVAAGPVLEGRPFLSDGTWRVQRVEGWSALAMDPATVGGGYIAGATEQLDAAAYPWGWREPGFDDKSWPKAEVIGKASHGGLDTWQGTLWALQARTIPLLDCQRVPIGTVREAELNGRPWAPSLDGALTVPPRSEARLLIDRGVLDMGFPLLVVSAGAGSTVQLRYQEALFYPDGTKGNRDVVEGKVMKGYYDRYLPDGAAGRVYEPAWIRVYRFLELTVETGAEPLVIDRLSLRQVRYPFERVGGFRSSDASLEAILDASWRTLELCALETYMDCPYYEQVQYIGDTRIQALISLYLTGDDRLMRRAIAQFDRSRLPMGLTRSSYPVRGTVPQIIPPFTLLYISMVHDYYMHRHDPEFLEPLLPGIRFSLEWFLARRDERGLLGPLPYWNHTDGGAVGFRHGSPPGASTGGSIQLTLLLVAALHDAADLSASLGREGEAEWYWEHAAALRTAAHTHGYDATRGLYAETPAKEVFSQHTNAFAILTETVPSAERAALARKLVEDETLTRGTLYFQFYVFEALAQAGMGERILPELDRWREMLALGLTTFPEHGPESRSDAHAWAAHPLFHLLATTAGVRSGAPGFTKVLLRPAMGALTEVSAEVCHPKGMISSHYRRTPAGTVEAVVELPPGLSGALEWEGRILPLKPGRNELQLGQFKGVRLR